MGGRIIVQQEKISRAERSWTNPLNALQQAIQYCFIKFCIYFFPLWREFFVQYTLRVEKILSSWSWCRTFGIPVTSAEGMTHQPIRTLSLCFGVIGETPGLISRNNFVKKILSASAIAIMSWQDVTIYPLLRCQGVWNKTCTQLSRSQIIFQNQKNYSLGDVQRFCYHSWCDSTHFWSYQQQQQCLPQFESILDGHLSRHLLPPPLRLEIENTT